MNDKQISIFKGFSKHHENTGIIDCLNEIRSPRHAKNVAKIRFLVSQDNADEAAKVKKQLRAATLSATYQQRRLPENITGYNDVLMLDFDKLSPGELTHCRKQIEGDGNTLFCFLSPSGNGLKAGVYMRTNPAETLRSNTLAAKTISYEKLERYHKQMFGIACKYYEDLCGVAIDPSGSDIGRLFFFSFDPDLYINTDGLEAVPQPTITVVPPPPAEKKKQTRLKKELPGMPGEDCSTIDPALQLAYQKCVASVRRSMTYTKGQRDMFLYTLGNKCYRKNLPEEQVCMLAIRDFGAPDMDVRTPIQNAYRYTTKTDRQEEENKKPIAARIVEYADQHYDIRWNVIMKRLEFRYKNRNEPFVPMKTKHFNSAFLDINLEGITCAPLTVKTVLNSRYAKDFHPFEDYFYNLPPWDGTDYIGRLADTVQTTNQDFWRDCLKRWLTGMIACALDESSVNQLALIINGAQGKGKSTWIRHLLPPELKHHYRNGMLNPDNKDHALALTYCLLINLEEFEGMRKVEIGELKRMITQESVMERKAFDTDADLYIRCASIIASTNEPRFLQDVTGNRRFPTVTATEIDYRTPVDHKGIYAQALSLWKSGFHYWYEESEMEMLNQQNMEYNVASTEEELLYQYFRKPEPHDLSIKWMSASAILSHMCIYGKLQVNDKNLRNLVRILEVAGFAKRMNGNSIFEYQVVMKTENM